MATVELRDIVTGADRAAALGVRSRPGGYVLYVSCGQGEGSPQAFYERYGFVPAGRVIEDEIVLELDIRPNG